MDTIIRWYIKQDTSNKSNIAIIVFAIVFPSTFFYLVNYPSSFFELPFIQSIFFLVIINVAILITGTFISILIFMIMFAISSIYLVPILATVLKYSKRTINQESNFVEEGSIEIIAHTHNKDINRSDKLNNIEINRKISAIDSMVERVEKLLIDFTSLDKYLVNVSSIYLLSSILRAALTVISKSAPDLNSYSILISEIFPNLVYILIMSLIIHLFNIVSLTYNSIKITNFLNSEPKPILNSKEKSPLI